MLYFDLFTLFFFFFRGTEGKFNTIIFDLQSLLIAENAIKDKNEDYIKKYCNKGFFIWLRKKEILYKMKRCDSLQVIY